MGNPLERLARGAFRRTREFMAQAGRGGALVLLSALFVLGLSGLAAGTAEAGGTPVGVVSAADLPPEARHVLQLIREGGPFPYAKDGTVFGNYERILPRRPRGYYREYTVPTPGLRNRGPRRIVAGQGPGRDVSTSGEYWYSPDHYETFSRIRE